MAKYLYNGVLLPEIPADGRVHHIIVTYNGAYRLWSFLEVCYHSNGKLRVEGGTFLDRAYYVIQESEDGAIWNNTSNGAVEIDLSNFPIIWTDHDILDGSADATEVFFYASEPVDPNAPEEPTAEVYYKISGERLKGFADQARRLGEVTGELTPEQIEDTLSGVTVGLTEEEAQAMVDAALASLKLQSKTVTPTEEQQTITADEGYFGLASVIVEAAEAGGGAAPDGMEVTFGYEDGAPVEREEAYTILSADLNELGAISQKVAGKSTLMTLDEMLYYLNRAKFIPQGFANSVFDMSALNFESSAMGELQEG